MNRAVRHESFLAWRNFRHLKWACVLSILSVGLYLGFDFPAGHNGGTWLGYTLGTIGALLIVWLMWFGIRKRRYGPGNWSLKGWLSAHVYLGLSLVIVGTLHTGFQLGWNIHSLAYILMLIVIASGAIGLLVYVRVPQLMTENRRSQSLDEMARAIVEIDGEAAKAALQLSDEFAELVRMSQNGTHIGGSFRRIITARDSGCGTARAIARAREISRNLPPVEAQKASELARILGGKLEIVQRARRDLRLKALLDLWLYIHVPVTIALVITLIAHIIAVYFYWG
ncbi:MAG: hypothetical protein KDF64_10890 [Geminicoccaceae bacterium]|nr:hypothetical protein [Geminicoccaceae bacterium]